MFIRLAGYRDDLVCLPRSTDFYHNLHPRRLSIWTPGLRLGGLLDLYGRGFQMGDYLPVELLKRVEERDMNVVALLLKSEHRGLCGLFSVPSQELVKLEIVEN